MINIQETPLRQGYAGQESEKGKVKSSRGVAVLFAVLVSVLLISIAVTMISISLRQTILSSTGRDSQYALFAANTVLECAKAWDLNPNDVELGQNEEIFPIDTANEPSKNEDRVTCNNGSIITGDGFTTTFAKDGWDNLTPGTHKIFIEIRPTVPGSSSSGPYCASATITKTSNSDGGMTTVIQGRGYNTCDLTSTRAIERGLEVSYTS